MGILAVNLSQPNFLFFNMKYAEFFFLFDDIFFPFNDIFFGYEFLSQLHLAVFQNLSCSTRALIKPGS